MTGPQTDAGVPGALRRLLLAQSLSQLGFRVMTLAVPIVAITVLHASPFTASVVSASQTAAFLIIGLPAGALVDRMPRRMVLIVSDFARAAVLATLPLAWWLGSLSIWHLCVAVFVIGTLTVFFDVANQSYLPEIVGRQQLIAANSRLVMVDQLTGITGPGLGGLLMQTVSAPVAFVPTSVGYLWSGALIAGIRDGAPRIRPRPRTRLGKEIMDGVRYVRADPYLRPIVLCSTTQTLFWSVGYLMLLVLLAGELAASPAMIGVLLTVGSLGGVLATSVVSRLIRRLGDGRALRLGVTVGGPCTLIAAFTQSDWRLWLVSVASFGLGFGLVVYNVAQVSFRQRRVPAHLLGRVNATIRFTAWGARPLGSLLGGVLASVLSVRSAVVIGAAGTSLAAVWLYLSPLGRMRDLPTDTIGTEPPASGPPGPVPSTKSVQPAN
jgi:MFS family permease